MSAPGLPPRCETSRSLSTATENSIPATENSIQSCSYCGGTGERGIFGSPGLGLVRRPCPACSGQSDIISNISISVLRSCKSGASLPSSSPSEILTDDDATSTASSPTMRPTKSSLSAYLSPWYRHARATSEDSPCGLNSPEHETIRPASATSVVLHVYWMRSVAFDEQGRIQRTAKSSLTWGRKFVKDLLGVYHVGLEVYGTEYTYGNYHAPESQRLGGTGSGVHRHQPKRPGPRYVFKEAVDLGETAQSAAQVEEAAEQLGRVDFQAAAYDRIRHNCVDFVRELAELLGAEQLPLWCHRGAAAARLLQDGKTHLKSSLSTVRCRTPTSKTFEEPELRF